MSKPSVSLRVKVPLPLYERIGEYRHLGRHNSKNQAMVTLFAAGLAALSKPPALPPPDRPKQLVAFAGSEGDGHAAAAPSDDNSLPVKTAIPQGTARFAVRKGRRA